jgi:hypothetical protein
MTNGLDLFVGFINPQWQSSPTYLRTFQDKMLRLIKKKINFKINLPSTIENGGNHFIAQTVRKLLE